jgi:hypothetical protein
MNISAVHISRYLTLAVLGVLLVSAAWSKKPSGSYSGPQTTPVAPMQANAPLSANDVSWLPPSAIPSGRTRFSNNSSPSSMALRPRLSAQMRRLAFPPKRAPSMLGSSLASELTPARPALPATFSLNTAGSPKFA